MDFGGSQRCRPLYLGTCSLPLPRNNWWLCGQPLGGLPAHCSASAALPRCSSVIHFSVESRQASKYDCAQTVAGQGGAHLFFRGQQCGYDLIRWSNATRFSPHCTQGLSLACGQAPEGELLPRMCVASANEPAIFNMYTWDKDKGAILYAVLKFLDDGTLVVVSSDRFLQDRWVLSLSGQQCDMIFLNKRHPAACYVTPTQDRRDEASKTLCIKPLH